MFVDLFGCSGSYHNIPLLTVLKKAAVDENEMLSGSQTGEHLLLTA
jgi:hypothetical protein